VKPRLKLSTRHGCAVRRVSVEVQTLPLPPDTKHTQKTRMAVAAAAAAGSVSGGTESVPLGFLSLSIVNRSGSLSFYKVSHARRALTTTRSVDCRVFLALNCLPTPPWRLRLCSSP
jgi:hypothetical protein